ncbi:hypothetical protein KBI5_20495 [Frankia sp. KB5]|nr:hypothetical protein KBI5_20495 [Frankia sp. KB5]
MFAVFAVFAREPVAQKYARDLRRVRRRSTGWTAFLRDADRRYQAGIHLRRLRAEAFPEACATSTSGARSSGRSTGMPNAMPRPLILVARAAFAVAAASAEKVIPPMVDPPGQDVLRPLRVPECLWM